MIRAIARQEYMTQAESCNFGQNKNINKPPTYLACQKEHGLIHLFL